MRLPRSRGFYAVIAVAALGILFAANAHLVYVAATSQPDCVSHSKGGDLAKAPDAFAAAKSSC